MKPERSVFVHLGLLGASAVLAVGVWTRDKAPKALSQSEVTVFSARPADVGRIDFEGKTKKVSLERKEDKLGAYLVGTIEKSAAPPKAPPDAGAEPNDDEAPEAAPGPATKTTVVSVGAGNKLLDALAPLKALRAIGKVPDDRAAEFGLAEPEGSLTIGYKSGAKKLVVGGATPGGADRYVRDEATGEVYVIKGDTYRDLDSADQRLVERDLHEWKEPEIAKAKISAGGKAREVVRGGSGDGKKFWADGGSPGTNDETVGNWMSKLDRLKPSEYVLAAPEGQESVVRIDYASSGNPSLGYVELVKVPAKDGGKAEWYVTSERLRAFGKVPANNAEQVESDIGAVVK